MCAHVTEDEWPEFLEFFDAGALHTSAARVHGRLGLTDPTHRTEAVTRLNQALNTGPGSRARQRAFNLIWLATCTIADGDLTNGAEVGNDVLTAVRALTGHRRRIAALAIGEALYLPPGWLPSGVKSLDRALAGTLLVGLADVRKTVGGQLW